MFTNMSVRHCSHSITGSHTSFPILDAVQLHAQMTYPKSAQKQSAEFQGGPTAKYFKELPRTSTICAFTGLVETALLELPTRRERLKSALYLRLIKRKGF